MDTLNERFVELTKAYKALTDEEIRNNYLQYGHPDGKQSFSVGIALPKIMITEGNGKYILLMYGGLLGVLLPYIVGKWWYGSQRYTKEKILVASASNLFREYKNDLTVGRIVNVLSSGEEFRELQSPEQVESGLAKLERKVLIEMASLPGAKEREEIKQIEDPARRRALALLWAYLGRIDLHDDKLNADKYAVAPIALALNESFSLISLAFFDLEPLLGSYKASQDIIQAVIPGSSPLLQLPYFDEKVIKSIERKSKYVGSHLTVQEFMKISEEKRRAMTVGAGLLSEEKYAAAVSVARQIPVLEISKAFFKVVGEKVITPSSLVQLVLKARFIPPGATDVPAVTAADVEDVDPDEDDIDAFVGRRASKKNGDEGQPPLAYAPYLCRDYAPKWNIVVANAMRSNLAMPPFRFEQFDKPIFTESGDYTYNMQTLRVQFQGPAQVEDFNFSIYVVCDSYIGFDSRVDVTLSVQEPAKAVALEEDDISEPDEGAFSFP